MPNTNIKSNKSKKEGHATCF